MGRQIADRPLDHGRFFTSMFGNDNFKSVTLFTRPHNWGEPVLRPTLAGPGVEMDRTSLHGEQGWPKGFHEEGGD